MDKFEEAFAYFRELLTFEKSLDASFHKKALQHIARLSNSILIQGDLELALLYKKEVLNYSVLFFGEDDFSTNLRQQL